MTGDNLQLHLDGRTYYFSYITRRALEEGLLPFYWDIGQLLGRSDPQVLESQAYQGLIEGARQRGSLLAQSGKLASAVR